MLLRQEFRLRQEQVLQPQQILRSELIQLPQLLLEARFQQEFEQNPLLEELNEVSLEQEEPEENTLESAAVDEAKRDAENVEAKEAEKEESEIDWETYFEKEDNDNHYEYKAKSIITEPVEIPQADISTLADLLTNQLRVERITDRQRHIGDYIIGSLDTRGYLDASIKQIADMAEVTEAEVEEVLHRIQRYEPAGIAARDLRECLLLQLEASKETDTVAYKVIRNYYEDFKSRRFETIASGLSVTLLDVQQSFDIISRLDPRPGEGVIDEKMNYVIPDLVVEEIGGEFIVTLNDGNIPSFYINEELKKLILSKKGTDKSARDFAIQKAESARWFVNAIVQRRTTMMRTMRAIVERQLEWFESGRETDIKPLILNDIAEMINMDISTISRVTRDKYVQTPYGVYELKYYFNDKMANANGEEVATRTIKAKLKEVVENENKSKPMSDQQIADILKVVGFPIARRTVQKYREQLNIPVKRMRRVVA
ncbi:MAG: RNA polymerase factor sigma-54 [Candidatus Electryonea clarkiae]|nr:RNA polymerase factor sigma-54 [Candidatus Electryonea clarkiae]MDP8289040.1 RNA polymerase factor sigma-54 [Candidatus Electryonea clarkiae]